MKRLILLCFLCVYGQVCHAMDFPDFPFIYAEGKAVTNVSPDMAEITLTVTHYDAASSNAVATVESAAIRLIRMLEDDFSIGESAIAANNLSKRAIRRRKDYEELEIEGYEVSRQITVTLDDIEKFPLVMRKLSSMDYVVDLRSSFDRKDRDMLLTALTRSSCQKARRKAQVLAEASDGKLGDVFAISTDGLDNISTTFRSRNFSAIACMRKPLGSRSAAFFAPATIELRMKVSAIYKLK